VRRVLFLVPVALFAIVAGYFAYSLRPDHDPRRLPSALLNRPAPDFSLPRLGVEGMLTNADLAGQVTVINVFASWCAPCRIEHPVLTRLARDRAVRLIGIAYKDKPEDSTRFLAELGDPYRAVGVDREGRAGIDFGVYGVPETYVLDREGRIRLRFVGPLSARQAETELLPLLQRLAAP
jgi:cytochrome c biogenesis protein CcmG/thiol:disulfide interchange protein DsbE